MKYEELKQYTLEENPTDLAISKILHSDMKPINKVLCLMINELEDIKILLSKYLENSNNNIK